MRFLVILPCLCISSLFAGSLRIMNDSPYTLSAEVLSADGVSQGKLTLGPQQQSTWQSFDSDNSVWSQTPYTVIFTCKTGKQYGVFSGAQQGATVNALSSTGNRYCEPEKQDDQNNTSTNNPAPNNPENSYTPAPWNPGPPDPHNSPGDPIWGPP